MKYIPEPQTFNIHVILVRNLGGEENGHLPPSPREYRSVCVCVYVSSGNGVVHQSSLAATPARRACLLRGGMSDNFRSTPRTRNTPSFLGLLTSTREQCLGQVVYIFRLFLAEFTKTTKSIHTRRCRLLTNYHRYLE